MARFGLDSDSDDESVQSVPPANGAGSSSASQTYESDEEPPPRQSLAQSDEETIQDEHNSLDSDSVVEDSFVHTERARRAGTESTYGAPSIDVDQSDTDSIEDSDSSSSASQAMSALPGSTVGGPSWPQALGLEPKRVAVMQASFFHQQHQLQPPPPHSPARALSAAPVNPFARTSTAPVAPGRPNFTAPVIDRAPFRQFRKYARVDLDQSISKGKEANVVDAGLALGRSFRIGCGQQGQLVHLGKLYNNSKPTKADSLAIDKLRLVANSEAEAAAALRLLKLQLEHTPIYSDDPSRCSTAGVPYAVPHPELRFSHFAALAPSDRSPEAHLWRLGHALFDEIDDLELPLDPPPTAQTARYIEEIRRRDLLERWLEDAVKGDVEDDLRRAAASSSAASAGQRVFAMLSGHQIERACEAAVEAGDLRLATLLAQVGGDDDFREDVYQQLAKWRDQRVGAHISPHYRKVYELLCGNVGQSEGVAAGDKVDGEAALHVSESLDWKRAFGLQLWYGTFQTPVATAVDRYEAAAQADEVVAAPFPAYIEKPSAPVVGTSAWACAAGAESATDPLFELLKIFTDATHPLEQALLPRNFGSSPLDYRLPWHLYVLFSRVLRRRDFEDRVDVGEDGAREGVLGNSVRADAVTESYAAQLESIGLWQWSCFVLEHLELADKRERAIRAVLTRHAAEIDDVASEFLVETLRVPPTWIYSAQAIEQKYKGDVFGQYKLLLAAAEHSLAHRIAVVELGPEAVIRNDLALLRRLFDVFEPQETADWEAGGKVFTDYADCLDELAQNPTSEVVSDLLETLLHSVPALLELSPKSVKLQVCVSEMQSRLTKLSSQLQLHLSAVRPSVLQEADRLTHLQGANKNFLEEALRAACAA